MNKIIMAVMVALLLVPFAASAQERTMDETTLVLNSKNAEGFADLLVDCAWAMPYLPMEVDGGWRSELYSVTTNEMNGKSTDEGEMIGEMWTCYDGGQEVIDPVGPSYEQAIAYAIFIDDDIMGALGVVRFRAGGDGLPNMYGVMASVSRIVDDVPAETLGSMTVNELVDRDGVYGGYSGIVVLRLFTPRDYVREMFIEIFSGKKPSP